MAAGSIGAVGVDVEVDGSKVPGQVEKSATSGMAGVGSRIGKTLVDGISSAAAIGGTVVAGVIGTALAKGFSRLEAIDTAKAKLVGLGQSAENIASIMDSATKAVKGTAFGLGDAASAAAQFSAAGIPLDQIQRSLTILASSAAVAGTGMGDMTTIFGKVAATGKLNGEVLQQLSERGIPVLSFLAKQYGVTAEEARQMVSDGKVSFADFQNVMESNLGPAAQAMGQSFRGMLTNVGAALGRLGAAAQGPAFESLKTLFPPITSAIDQLTKVVKPLADALGTALAPYVERLAAALSGIDLTNFAASLSAAGGGASQFVSVLAPLLPLLLGALGAFGPLASTLPVIGPLFSGITGPVGLLAGALIALLAFNPATLSEGFATLAGAIPGAISGIVSAVLQLIPQILQRLAQNIPVVANGIVQLLTSALPMIIGAIPAIVSAFVSMVPMIINALAQLVPAVIGLIPMLVATFATMIPRLLTVLLGALPALLSAALTLFLAIIQAVVQAIPLIVAALMQMLPVLLTTILSMLPSIIAAALNLFLGIVEAVVTAIPQIISSLLDLLPVLLTTVLGMLPDLIMAALDLFLGLVLGLAKAIPDLISALVALLPKLITTLVNMIPTLINAAVELFLALVKALPIIIPQLLSAIIGMAPQLVGAVISMVPQLIDGGVQLIAGLIRGITSAAGRVAGVLIDIVKNAVGGVLSFLGINSPSKLMFGYGGDTMDGYINAIKAAKASVGKALMGTIKAPIQTTMNVSGTPSVGPNVPPGGPPGAGAGSTSTRVVNVNEGAVKVEAEDPYKASLLVVDGIAERVAV